MGPGFAPPTSRPFTAVGSGGRVELPLAPPSSPSYLLWSPPRGRRGGTAGRELERRRRWVGQTVFSLRQPLAAGSGKGRVFFFGGGGAASVPRACSPRARAPPALGAPAGLQG